MAAEFRELWRLREFLRVMAINDLRRRFRRTAAGLFYLVLFPLTFALALAFVFGRIFGRDFVEFVPFVLAGNIIWEMLTGACLQGAQSIVGSEGYIRHYRLPFALYPLRAALGVVMQASIAFVVLVAWVVVTRPATIGPAWWALPPAFVLLVVLSAALSILCSVLTAQLRDLAPLMAALFPVLWLMSPITIPPDAFRAARAGWLVDLNPVYYIVELVRAPLLRGEWPALHPVLVSTSVVAAVTLAAFAALAASGRRLVYRL